MIYKYLCIVILEMIVKQFVVGCYYHVNGVDLMVCPCILFLFYKFTHFRPTELLFISRISILLNLFYKNISIHIVCNNQKYHNIKFVSINSKSSIHYDLPLCCSLGDLLRNSYMYSEVKCLVEIPISNIKQKV